MKPQGFSTSDSQYRVLFESHPQPLWVYDLSTLNFLAVNDAAVRRYGFSRDEFLAMTIKDIRPLEDIPALLENVSRVHEGMDDAGRWRHRKKDGSIILVQIVSHMVEFEERRAELVMATDITERVESQEAQSRLQQAIRNSHDVVFMTDADGRITYVNPEFEALYGYSFTEVIGRNPRILKSGKTGQEFYEQFWKTIRAGKTIRGEIMNRTKDGRFVQVETTVDPVLNESRQITGFIAIQRDITERKRTEAALRESENRFRRLAENAQDLIYRYEFLPARGFTYVSPAATIMTGFTPEEHYADPDLGFKIIHPDDRHLLLKASESIESGASIVLRWIRKDGTVLWTEQRNVPIHDSNGTMIAVEGIARDITGRKEAEMALRESENRFRQITETIQEVFWMTNTEKTRMLYVSPAYEKIWGRTVEDLYRFPQSWMDAIHPDDRERVQTAVYTEQAAGDYNEVYRIRRSDGSERWIHDRAFPVNDEAGRIVGVTGIAEDITARKLAEKALMETETKFRTLAESASSAIFIYNQLFTYVNPAAEVLTGYSRDELLRMNFWDVVHPDHRELVRQRGMARLSGQSVVARYEFKILRKDGQERWIDFSAGMYTPEGSANAVGMAIDITERKLAEEALRKSEAWHRSFFEDDLTGDFISTPHGNIVTCNPAFARIFGFASVEDALKGNAWDFHASREAREKFLELLYRERRLEYHEIDGRTIDGRTLHLVENVIGIFNDEGKLVQIKGYLFDDTRRRQLEQKLIEAQKMESIGTLAGGIAHDFNNILGIILGHVGVLERSEQKSEKQTKSIDAITKATQRGAGLVRQILTFARKSDARLESVRLNDVVEEVAKLLSETLPKKIDLQLSLTPDLPAIIADQTQIHQAILNLAVNARDAMPDGGGLSIRTAVVPGEYLAGKIENGHSEKYVLLRLEDTGTGMSESTRLRIFEPFFTTKEKGKGTGLGLAVVYGVVKSHGGHVMVESEIGKGTAFELFFPVPAVLRDATPSDSSAEEPIPGGNETILFIEDEHMLMDIVTTILRTQGYKVIQAFDGRQALQEYQKNFSSIDLVLSDIGLPGLTGMEVFHHMKTTKPDVQVILSTGYIEPDQKAQLLRDGVKEVLAKPYRQAELLKKVRRVLDGR